MYWVISIIVSLFFTALGGYFYWKSVTLRRESAEAEAQTKQRLYELGILKELSDRVGYSLNIEKIIDVISGSLKQLIEYSTVSYMLIEPEKIKFKISLDTSVSRHFVEDVRGRMLRSISALLEKEFTPEHVDETITGALVTDENDEPVRSFFNIPLVIDSRVVGVLTVADTQEGLYKEAEMTILHKITNQASQAVTRLERVVRNEQGKLSAMVESMNEGVVMTDTDYRVQVMNPAAQKALGFISVESVSLFDIVDRVGTGIDLRGKLDESTRLKKVIMVDDVVIGERYFQIFVAPVHGHAEDDAEDVFGNVIILHDRSHEKELERMRKDFTSMMVHELRSPLDSIKKIGEMMRGDMIRNSADLYDEYVKMIYKSSSQMLELVNDLLDVAKLESGKFELHIQPAQIKQILKERLQFFRATADDGEVNLSAMFGSSIPENVDFDPFRISQVLNNLLSNAIKFTEAGGKVTLQAMHHRKGVNVAEEAFTEHIDWLLDTHTVESLSNLPDCIIVAVTDTGPGIAPENIPKLFNKFAQFEAGARSDKKGTGLGLVISKGIIQTHKGIIGLGSKKGVGSTFYFTIAL